MTKVNQLELNNIKVIDSLMNESIDVELKTKFNNQQISVMLANALKIVKTYDKGNGKFEIQNLPTIDYMGNMEWLLAYGLYNLSKEDNANELFINKAVSKKHADLLAKCNTGKYDFTSLMQACTFINKIDTTLQQFTFKRESKTVQIDLNMLREQLKLLELDLIIEQSVTRSGSTVTNYYYDIKQTKGA